MSHHIQLVQWQKVYCEFVCIGRVCLILLGESKKISVLYALEINILILSAYEAEIYIFLRNEW